VNRLHIAAERLRGRTVVVRDDALLYLRDVLRLRPGAPVEVFDGEGGVYPSTLGAWLVDGAELELGPREERAAPGVRVTLAQGIPKGDRIDFIVQKAVELGAQALVPVACERSVVKLDAAKAADRVQRWQRIAEEAARQCGRADTCRIDPVCKVEQLVFRPAQPGERRLVLDEEERTVRLRDELRKPGESWTILIGPEGGLARDEVDLAVRGGYVPVTLGPRILRTETAGMAVLAVMQHVLGDLG
jgi:16S rRNA (uracil1498-N3)-methyltransferase